MDKIKKCYTPPAKDWTLGPEGEADQPDATTVPAGPGRVQPSQDQAVKANDSEILQGEREIPRPLSDVEPGKRARKEARRRRVPAEVEDEEPEVVDSPRVRKRPEHLKDFVCRNMNTLSPIYEEPEVEGNLPKSECM